MTFSERNSYDRILQKVTHKGGESKMNCFDVLQNAQALSVSVGNSYSEDELMHISWITFTKVENILHK